MHQINHTKSKFTIQKIYSHLWLRIIVHNQVFIMRTCLLYRPCSFSRFWRSRLKQMWPTPGKGKGCGRLWSWPCGRWQSLLRWFPIDNQSLWWPGHAINTEIRQLTLIWNNTLTKMEYNLVMFYKEKKFLKVE